MYRMSVKYDNWNEWYLNEKNKNGKEYIYGTIHPAGYNKDEKEWLTSGKIASDNTINEISLKKKESVLEYGCGAGRILRHLKKYNSYGVDIVEDFVLDARKLGCKSYLLENFSRRVDKVFSLTVFIHLRKEQAITALKYIHKHLKKNGTAYIQALIYQKDKDATNFSDMTCYRKETFIKMCEENGFRILNIYENHGDIDKQEYGENHNRYQVLEKI